MLDKLVLRNVWMSSWVLSLSLFGDALLYVVLPVHAEAFGVSMVMVGFLLAVNRIIRIFFYGVIVQLAERVGVKSLCIGAAITATLSTAGYAFFDGEVMLVLSRMLWGLSFAALLLVTLTYAAVNPAKTGTRIGISRSVEQVGPLLAMTVGAWLVAQVGPRDVFAYLALATSLSVVLALMLNGAAQPERLKKPAPRDSILPRPDSLDMMIFWMGAGIDGVFTVSVSLMWAQYLSVDMAILFGGGILAARRLSEMLLAPCAGMTADRFGIRIPLLMCILLTIAGFGMIGAGLLMAGSIVLVLVRGALGTFFPSAVARIYAEAKIKALARNQTWRDVGAALGPLATGASLSLVSPESMHVVVAVAFAVCLAGFVLSPGWAQLARQPG
jgi:DHA1 family inner membrane transport protein